MAYDLAKVTANGNNLIAQILANKSSLSIDKIEISDTQLSSTTDISTMTSVPKVVQTVSANGFSKNSNTLIISTVVDNSSISADYKAWVFGIWGSDSQNGQSQLIAVITSTNSPDTIPAFSGSTPVSYTYKFNIGFSNASQIQFNMIDDAFATNDTVVHTTGDETIDGQKKFDTDPTDGAGNAYAKTVDVNQQLDKKVNVSDMRKPASDVAGIEEVNAKQDKIGYTPADDSKVVHDTDAPSSIIRNYLDSGTDLNTITNPGIFPFNQCTFVNDINSSVKWGAIINNVLPNQIIMQEMIRGNGEVYGYRIYNGGNKHWSSWLMPADDSKVAHLSGANNFDTVPTVNNNPLLLASSLPSDLARTGQDTNFTAGLQKSGIDVATTDDLTIVYAGVPSLSFDNNGNYTITASKNADIAHITDYTLYYRVKGNGDFNSIALTSDKLTGTIDLSKVTMATNFESYATATNVFGESDPSSTVQWNYDPEKASSTPPSLAIADDGTYTITAPTTTPTPIVKYFLYYNVDGQSDATKLDVGTELTGSLKELITKPNKTTTYDVQATAMNANAESGVSNSVQFTYVPIDDSIYGASWDRKSSPTLTRTDAAVGLKAGINGAQNDFDNVGPWKGMHRVTDSMNNVFVRVPKFYIRKTQTGSPDNGTATWQVSLVSHGDDWYLPKGFWDFTNSKELDYIDIGAYDATGSSSKLTSVAGKAPLVNLSIANFRKAAQANGTGYQIWDIHAWDMLQVLFIIEFATLNSQSVMEGVDSGSSAANSGVADSHEGSSGTAGSGSNAMSYRGIENLYGNVWQLCDGANFKNNQPWVCEDATNYQSDLFAAPYVSTSYTATSDNANNYIKAMGFDSVHPYAQFTTDDSGSESTYYADYDWPGSGNTILETSGSWGNGAYDGLFGSLRGNSSTDAHALDGCRLLKKALP
jgi:hypothetical protein